jgi:hypothetical protein
LPQAHGPVSIRAAGAASPIVIIEQPSQNAIQGLQKKMVEAGAPIAGQFPACSSQFFDLAVMGKNPRGSGRKAMILFRSPGLFQYYLLHGQFKEAQTVDNRFHVRPLLRTLTHETRFHSGTQPAPCRLLDCTQHRAQPAPTRAFPTNLHAWLNIASRIMSWRIGRARGRPVGAMKGVVSSTSTDREREDEYLRHFFREVDKGVTAHLHRETGPLLLAGVEHEIAIYPPRKQLQADLGEGDHRIAGRDAGPNPARTRHGGGDQHILGATGEGHDDHSRMRGDAALFDRSADHRTGCV